MALTVFALPIGVINIQSGKTMYDWSIYDGPSVPALYLCGGFLLYGAPGSLNEGDKIVIRHNDTQRKLQETTVRKVLSGEKDKLIAELLENGYDYRVLRAFAKKRFSAKLSTSYSIKGVVEQ